MELQHINVKIDALDTKIEQAKFTPLFHRWIQEQVCNELLIDVADYLHVDAGPGIVLIGNEADYSMDNSDHRLGLRYNRKLHLGGSNEDRLKQALKSTLLACQRLESDPSMEGKLKFSRNELEIFINDRAHAPNTEATWKICKSEFEKFLANILDGNKFTMTHDKDPRVRFGIKIQTEKPFKFETLLKNCEIEG